MSDFTQCQKGPDMVLAMESMEWLERATRREYQGCQSCKHQLDALGVKFCGIERVPFRGRLFCGRWSE